MRCAAVFNFNLPVLSGGWSSQFFSELKRANKQICTTNEFYVLPARVNAFWMPDSHAFVNSLESEKIWLNTDTKRMDFDRIQGAFLLKCVLTLSRSASEPLKPRASAFLCHPNLSK